jgi:hypothetical protein
MYPYKFCNFNVKIKEKKYTTATGIEYSKTAGISFYNEYEQEIYYAELGYISIDEIYNKIQSGEDLNFNELYFEIIMLLMLNCFFRKKHLFKPSKKINKNLFYKII